MLSTAEAQIHQPGQRFIEAGGGLLQSGQIGKRANAGYWLKVSLGKYGKKEGVYQIGLMAQQKWNCPKKVDTKLRAGLIIVNGHIYLIEN